MINPNLKPGHATSSVPKTRKARKPTLAIDFDHTIHDAANPLTGKRMGAPFPDAANALHELANEGYRIIIHSCKAVTDNGKQVVIDWLDYYDLPYDEVTAIKPNADFYIDNKAVHHTDWATTLIKIGFQGWH